MKRRVTQHDLATPHFVEWGVSDEGEADEYECRYFVDRAPAKVFAHEQDRRFQAVWLGEIGDYQTSGGNRIRDWIYYWWNARASWPEVPFQDAPPPMRIGRPGGLSRFQLVDYRPYQP